MNDNRQFKEVLVVQQLYFHPSWDKTISEQDRLAIEQLFDETYTQVDDTVTSPVFRTAVNHKGELLVTVLVHNFTHRALRFSKRDILLINGDEVHEQTVSIADFTVPAFTSMPWTFMFQEVAFDSNEKIVLEIL